VNLAVPASHKEAPIDTIRPVIGHRFRAL
jgi:hypothetical protein